MNRNTDSQQTQQPSERHQHEQFSNAQAEPLGRAGARDAASGADDTKATPADLNDMEAMEREPETDGLSPEDLVDEDADPAPSEAYVGASEGELNIVSKDEIGAGGGLDEAELGRIHPLDGRPWDGDPDEPLGTD